MGILGRIQKGLAPAPKRQAPVPREDRDGSPGNHARSFFVALWCVVSRCAFAEREKPRNLEQERYQRPRLRRELGADEWQTDSD